MKIALLSGAYKNAGDFLIVKRSKELLKKVHPNCIITEYERRKDLTPVLNEINQHDVLILAGGPGYQPNIYPVSIPLVENLDKITTRFFALGMGWKGRDTTNRTIYNYKFSESTNRLMRRIESDEFAFGCRDWYSVRILKNNGFKKTKMTGCPAWYNLPFISNSEIVMNYTGGAKKICISDPGLIKNFDLVIPLIKYLKRQFPESEIKFVFHRGMESDINTSNEVGNKLIQLRKLIDNMKIECINIAYSSEGLSVYDNCDLHIGFRVHAHIYNLSRRNISVLVEEDGRGAGVNEALGLQSISTYDYKMNFRNKYLLKISKKLFDDRNSYFESNIDDYLKQLTDSNYLQVSNAFVLMQSYYNQMLKHIESISKSV